MSKNQSPNDKTKGLDGPSSLKARRSQRAKNSRRSGHAFENEVAAFFRARGFPNARRNLEYHEKDATGCDLKEVGPFKVQCKNYATAINPLKVLAEIKEDGYKVAFVKRKKEGMYVVLNYDAFAYLMEVHRLITTKEV